MAVSMGSAPRRVRGGYDNESEGIIPVSQCFYAWVLL